MHKNLLLITIFILAACNSRQDLTSQSESETRTLLFTNPTAEGTYRTCLFEMYSQGVGIQRATEECLGRLPWQFQLGSFKPGVSTYLPTGGNTSASAYITTSGCVAGDPRASDGGYAIPPGGVRYGVYGVDWNDSRYIGRYGGYSWGGQKGSDFIDDSGQWWQIVGLSEAESKRQKEDAIADAEAKQKAFDEAADAEAEAEANYKANPTDANKQLWSKAREEARKAAGEALKASGKAQADPNLRPPSVSMPNPSGENACTEAAEGARQFLAECNRTGWKTYECQSLQAKMNHCPDPALILVDPNSDSLTCGIMEVDPAEIAKAWRQHCEKTILYGPNEPNPCEAAKFEGISRIPTDRICGDPHAYVTEDACLLEINVKKAFGFGQRDIQQVLLWAQRHLGGPIIVLPQIGPSDGPHPPYD